MGSLVYTQAPFEVSSQPAVSKGGGVRSLQFLFKATMGTQYDTGGQTFTQPTVPSNYDLFLVEVIDHDLGAGYDVRWNLDAATPKLLVYDEDNTSGVAAENADDATIHAVKVVWVRLTYVAGVS